MPESSQPGRKGLVRTCATKHLTPVLDSDLVIVGLSLFSAFMCCDCVCVMSSCFARIRTVLSYAVLAESRQLGMAFETVSFELSAFLVGQWPQTGMHGEILHVVANHFANSCYSNFFMYGHSL